MPRSVVSLKAFAGGTYTWVGGDEIVDELGSAEIARHQSAYCVLEEELGALASLTGSLRPTSDFVRRRLLGWRDRLLFKDSAGRVIPFRIVDWNTSSSGTRPTSFRAVELVHDLSESTFAYAVEGRFETSVEFYQRLLVDLLTVLLDTANGSASIFTLGSVDAAFASSRVDLSVRNQSHLALIQQALEQARAEAYWAYDAGTNLYTLEVVPAVGAGSVLHVASGGSEPDANVLALSDRVVQNEYFTRVHPRAGSDVDVTGIARARLPIVSCTVVSGLVVDIVLDSSDYIPEDDCWNGFQLWVYDPFHAPFAASFLGLVSDSTRSSATLRVDFSAGGIAPGSQSSVCTFLQADDSPVRSLRLPSAEAAKGRVDRHDAFFIDAVPFDNILDDWNLTGISSDFATFNVEGSNQIPEGWNVSSSTVVASFRTLDGWVGGGAPPATGNLEFYDPSGLFFAQMTGVTQVTIAGVGDGHNGTYVLSGAPSYAAGVTSVVILSPGGPDPTDVFPVGSGPTVSFGTTISCLQETGSAYVRTNDAGSRVVASGVGARFFSDQFLLRPNAPIEELGLPAVPFWSIWASVRAISGRVRMFFESGSGARFPSGSSQAVTGDNTRAFAVHFELDPDDDNRLGRIVFEFLEPGEAIFDAVNVTNSRDAYPLRSSRGPHELFRLAGRYLAQEGGVLAPLVTTELVPADVLFPLGGYDALALGQPVDLSAYFDETSSTYALAPAGLRVLRIVQELSPVGYDTFPEVQIGQAERPPVALSSSPVSPDGDLPSVVSGPDRVANVAPFESPVGLPYVDFAQLPATPPPPAKLDDSRLFVDSFGDLWTVDASGAVLPVVPETTAVATTVASRYVYPETYGAVGDNVTDDSAALVAAVNFAIANDRTLYLSTWYFMGSTPLLHTPLVPPRLYDRSINILGVGAKLSGLRWAGYAAGTKMIHLRQVEYYDIANIGLEGDQSLDPVLQEGFAIWLGDGTLSSEQGAAPRGRLRNLTVRYWKGALVLHRLWILDVISCEFNHNFDGVISGWDGSAGVYPFGGQVNAINFYGGMIESCDGHGVNLQLRSSSNINFYGTCIEGNGPFDWQPPVAWVTATAYEENRHVYNGVVPGVHANTWVWNLADGSNGHTHYRCTADHTSAAATEPGVGASWATVWEVGDPWAEAVSGAEVKIDGNWTQILFSGCYFEKGIKYNPYFQVNHDDTIVGPPPTTNDVQSGGQKGRRLAILDCSFGNAGTRMENIFDNIDELEIARPSKGFFGHYWRILAGVKKYRLPDPNIDFAFQYSGPSMWLPVEAKDGHNNSFWYRSDLSGLDPADFPITTTTKVVELDPSGHVTLQLTGAGSIDLETTEVLSGQYALRVGSSTGGVPSLNLRVRNHRDTDWLRRHFDAGGDGRGFWHYLRIKASNSKCWIYPYVAVVWWKDIAGVPTLQTASQTMRAFAGYAFGETIDNRWGWSAAQYKGTGIAPHTTIQQIIDDPDFLYLDYIDIRVFVESGNAIDADQFIYLDEIRFSSNRWGVSELGIDPHDDDAPLLHRPEVSWPREAYSDSFRPATPRPSATLLNRNRELYEPGERQWTVGSLPALSLETRLPGSKYAFYPEGAGADLTAPLQASIVLAMGPHGREIPVWRGLSDGTGTTLGGFRAPAKEVNHLDGFYVSLYVKALTGPTDASNFAILYDPDNTLVNAQTGLAAQTFWSGNLPAADTWYLVRSFVHASNEADIPLASVPNVGVYRADTKAKVADVTCSLRMSSSTKQVRIRAYAFAAGSPSGVDRHYAYPSLLQDVGEDRHDPYFSFGVGGTAVLDLSDYGEIDNGDGWNPVGDGWTGGPVSYDDEIATPLGVGAFVADKFLTGGSPVFHSEYLPVKQSDVYDIEVWLKSVGANVSTVYWGFACYDADGALIAQHHGRSASQFTTLASNAAEGATSVLVSDAALWTDGGTKDYVLAYPYKGYPVGLYSRHACEIDWANSKGGGGSAANQLTLLSALPQAVSAGTVVALSANITTAGQTSITLGTAGIADGTTLHIQSGANYERMRIVSSSGTTYTVERGVDQSTAATWVTTDSLKYGADLVCLAPEQATYDYIKSAFALDATGSFKGAAQLLNGWHYVLQAVRGWGQTLASTFRPGTKYVRLFTFNITDVASAEGDYATGLVGLDMKRRRKHSSASGAPAVSLDQTAGYHVDDIYRDTASGVLYICTSNAVGAAVWVPFGGGDVTAAAVLADDRLVRGDGGSKGVQGSGVTLDDSNEISGLAGLAMNGPLEHAGTVGFFGVTAASQGAHIADPSGGATIDSEARTAINAILARLETFGFNATS